MILDGHLSHRNPRWKTPLPIRFQLRWSFETAPGVLKAEGGCSQRSSASGVCAAVFQLSFFQSSTSLQPFVMVYPSECVVAPRIGGPPCGVRHLWCGRRFRSRRLQFFKTGGSRLRTLALPRGREPDIETGVGVVKVKICYNRCWVSRTTRSWPIQMKGPKEAAKTAATAPPSCRNLTTARLPLDRNRRSC